MQTIWQNPQHQQSGTSPVTNPPPTQTPPPSTTTAATQNNKRLNAVAPPKKVPTTPSRTTKPMPVSAPQSIPTTKKNGPTGSKRLHSSDPDPVVPAWGGASGPGNSMNTSQSNNPWGMPPAYNDPMGGGFGGPPPSPWGGSPYGGGFGGGPSGFSGGSPNEMPLSKMSEDQRQETIKKCFQLALAKKPEQKDFNYYKYSVLTETKLLHNLITGTQHKELVEKGQKFGDQEKRVRELEMQVKFQDEHVKNVNEEVQLLNKVLHEKNAVIQLLRENLNKLQRNPNRVEILDRSTSSPEKNLPATQEEAPPTDLVPTDEIQSEMDPTAEPSPHLVQPTNVLEPSPQTSTSAEHTSQPSSPPPEVGARTIFSNPAKEFVDYLKKLISPPY